MRKSDAGPASVAQNLDSAEPVLAKQTHVAQTIVKNAHFNVNEFASVRLEQRNGTENERSSANLHLVISVNTENDNEKIGNKTWHSKGMLSEYICRIIETHLKERLPLNEQIVISISSDDLYRKTSQLDCDIAQATSYPGQFLSRR